MNSIFLYETCVYQYKEKWKDIYPYLLSCIGTIAMFYLMSSLTENESISELPIGGSVKVFLGLGVGIIGFFAVLFLFYTNSFLVKRRKKEFGLFNILEWKNGIFPKCCFLKPYIPRQRR